MIRFVSRAPVQVPSAAPHRRTVPIWKAAEFTERAANKAAREGVAALLAADFQEIVGGLGDSLRSLELGTIGQEIAPLVDRLDWADFERAIGDSLSDRYLQGVVKGTELGERFAPAGVVADSAAVIQSAQGWISENALASAADITAESRLAVVAVLQGLAADQVLFQDAANQIGKILGLNKRQAESLRRFEAELVRQLSPQPGPILPAVRSTIDKRVARRRLRLLNQRGALIAGTEMQVAIRYGEDQFFVDAQEDFPIPILRVWKTVQDNFVCPICFPMHNTVVGVRAMFQTSIGLISGPPAHPRCRCWVHYDAPN